MSVSRRLALALGLAGPAAAQPARIPRESAPLAWQRFAEDVEGVLIAAFAAATPATERLRQGAAAGLRVRVWVAPDGRFERLETPAEPELGADLLALLADRRAPAPPAGMPWPMTLLVRLAPDAPGTDTG